MKDISAENIISDLNLLKHPEGGWYSETYRSQGDLETERGKRSVATVIYFMLKSGEKSAFHRLESDEFWYFHQGSSLDVHVIDKDGSYTLHNIGFLDGKGTKPQILLPAGCWFAAECSDENSYSLVSCSVHPGFDFEDFELADKSKLLEQFPQHREIISLYCI